MIARILDQAWIYRLWQAPFVRQKLKPFFIQNPNGFPSDWRVIELGCGPGTNAKQIATTHYFGWDLSPEYIAKARKLFPGLKFEVGDVTTAIWHDQKHPADALFMNSLLHHLSDEQVDQVLQGARTSLHKQSEVHIMDLLLPREAGIPRWLARADRGAYARSIDQWRRLFEAHFETKDLRVYSLSLFGIELWKMVYFSGTTRQT